MYGLEKSIVEKNEAEDALEKSEKFLGSINKIISSSNLRDV